MSYILKKYEERLQDFSNKTTQNITVIQELYMSLDGQYLEDRWKNIRLTMLYKIINAIVNMPNKEILIPANTNIDIKVAHTITNNTN